MRTLNTVISHFTHLLLLTGNKDMNQIDYRYPRSIYEMYRINRLFFFVLPSDMFILFA